VAGTVAQPEVLIRCHAELADPAGRIARNVYQRARGLEPAVAARLVDAAERTAARQAAAALDRIAREACGMGAASVRSCAVVVGASRPSARIESILASHALAHAAEGRLYQEALLRGAESDGLAALAVPRRSIWQLGESALGMSVADLRRSIDAVRREVGPPWAQDQKLAALAAWIALAGAGSS
jgi:hypothetical protein